MNPQYRLRQIPSAISSRKAFTLIELLVVVAIIVILVAIMMPSLSQARRTAMAVKCASQMRQAFIAVEQYCQENNDVYPKPIGNTASNFPYYIFLARLNYMDERAAKLMVSCPAYEKIAGSTNWYSPVPIGLNYNLGESWGTARFVKRVQIIKPAQFAVFSDSIPNWNDPIAGTFCGPKWLGRGNMAFRHGENANLIFADGHAGTFKEKDLPVPGTPEANNSPIFFFDK